MVTISVVATNDDTFDPITLDASGANRLQSLSADEVPEWYRIKRLRALRAAGLTSAGSWNPLLHPRGRDGRFINVFGYVRWLEQGKWNRGQISDINPDNGNVTVTRKSASDRTFKHWEVPKKLFSQPATKATLYLPDPKNGSDSPGFEKIGGQGGSNPGGMYAATKDVFAKKKFSTSGRLSEVVDSDVLNIGQKEVSAKSDVSAQQLFKSDFAGKFVWMDGTDTGFFVSMDGKMATGLDGLEFTTGTFDDLFGPPGTEKRAELMATLRTSDVLSDQKRDELKKTINSVFGSLPSPGEKYYVKTAKSEHHAKMEVLANELYELAGVPVPDVSLGAMSKDSNANVASKIVPGDDLKTLSSVLGDEAVLSKIREDLPIDAWLANWDVVGLSMDNIVVSDGVPYRIDAGGALQYRAMGASKGSMFGNEVGELNSLRDSKMNAQAAKVFGAATPAELQAGGERLAAIQPHDIEALVEQMGLDQAMSDKLIARRADILHQLGIKPVLVQADTQDVNVPSLGMGEASLDRTVWNPELGRFEKGELPDVTQADLDDQLTQMSAGYTDVANLKKLVETGSPVHVRQFGSIWKIDEIKLDGGSDDFHRVEMTHVVTGQKRSQLTYDSTDYEVITDYDTDNTIESWSVKYQKFAARVATETSKLGGAELYMAIGGSTDERLKMVSYPTASLTNVGDWVRSANSNDFYRVKDKQDDLFVTLEGLDGELVEAYIGTGYYVARPGSYVNHALDAARVRNKFKSAELTQDLDKSSMTGGTADDKALQAAAMASALEKTAYVPDTPIENPDKPAVPPYSGKYDDLDFSDVLGDKDLVNPQDLVDPTDTPPDPVSSGKFNSLVLELDEPEEFKFGIDADAFKSKFVGSVVNIDDRPDNPHFNKNHGLWQIENVKSTGDYLAIDVVDAFGNKRGFSSSMHSGQRFEVTKVGTSFAPITQLQFKKDETVAVNGKRIGTWEKTWGGKRKIVIDAEYALSGETTTIFAPYASAAKRSVVPFIVPPGSSSVAGQGGIGAKVKSPNASALEAAIRDDVQFDSPLKKSDDGFALTMADGSVAAEGGWVISKTDGSIGKIVKSHKSNGYIDVEMPDGSIKGRSPGTLSSSVNPDGKAPPPAPLYAKVKLSDGSQPVPGQKVLSGSNEFQIVEIKAGGDVRAIDLTAGGKAQVFKAGKLDPIVPTQLEKAVVDQSVGLGGFLAATNDSWKTAPKPKKIPYAAPGGKTIPQASNAVETYRTYAVDRKLTRDNFVPQVGMKVRDRHGEQFTIVRIAEVNSSNPSAIYTADKNGNIKSRQPSVMWADHEAMLSDANGNPIPKISDVQLSGSDTTANLPDGSMIFSYVQSGYVNGRYGQAYTSYVATLPDGSIRNLNAKGYNGSGPKYFPHKADKLTKVAFVDSASDTAMTFDQLPDTNIVAGTWIHPNEPGALEAAKAEKANSLLSKGLVEPEKFEGTIGHLGALPKPSTAAVDSGPVNVDPVPRAKGDGAKLKEAPSISGAYNISQAIAKLKADKKTDKVGKSVVYSMGDGNKIQDMSIRTQLAVDTDGTEYVEVRYGLLENTVDDLAKKLIISSSTNSGGWSKSQTLSPKDLVKGDVINVRISSNSTLKPGTGYGAQEPNATVAGPAVLVGKADKTGFDLYRIPLTLSSGGSGSILVEQRTTPSIDTFEWDASKVKPSGKFDGGLSPSAAKEGWTIDSSGQVSYDSATGMAGIQVDNDGRKIISTKTQSAKAVTSHNGAYTMRISAGGDSHALVKITHPASEDRSSVSLSNNKSIRSSVNGKVVLRVRADDPDIEQKLSDMMAATGVDADSQGAPDADALVAMAMNKLHKQFSPTYKHLETSGVTTRQDASGIQATLDKVKAVVGTSLDRDVTLDDIRFKTHSDGRTTVVLSDDLADALAKTVNFKGAYHNFSHGFKADMLAGKGPAGILSTDERWSSGLFVNGMSSSSDVTNDSGNSVYMRLTNSQPGAALNKGYAFVSARQITKQLDWYWNSGDYFGRRGESGNTSWVKTSNMSGSNELMLKTKIGPEGIAFVTFQSESAREKAIKDVKKGGVTHIGGRPIEEILVVDAKIDQLEQILPDSTGEVSVQSLM